MEITRTIIAVCLGLVVASQAQDCSSPVPGPNMNLKDSDILLTTFPDGSSVTFVCSLGYTTAGGSGVVTCTAGSWTKVTLHCEKKTCGSAGQVDDGEIEYLPGNEFGDKIVVTCNPGFRLVGKPELTCGDQGWLGRLPECEEVECADPKVANGEWVSGSRPPHKYLATVTYSCNAGYKMEGDATIECDLDGQWMPGIPKCKGPSSTTVGLTVGTSVGTLSVSIIVSVLVYRNKLQSKHHHIVPDLKA